MSMECFRPRSFVCLLSLSLLSRRIFFKDKGIVEYEKLEAALKKFLPLDEFIFFPYRLFSSSVIKTRVNRFTYSRSGDFPCFVKEIIDFRKAGESPLKALRERKGLISIKKKRKIS